MHLLQIDLLLRSAHRLVKQSQPQQPVPHDVIFQAPGIGSVKGQAVSRTVRTPGVLHPFCRHLLRGIGVFLFPEQLTVSAQRGDRLQAQVAVVRQVSREIIGAELVAGIVAVFDQVIRPFCQQIAVFLGKGTVSVRPDGCRHGQNRVAALLHRHLMFFIDHMLLHAVDLPVAERILSAVMRGVGQLPLRRTRIGEQRAHHALDQLRIQAQEKRNGGVGDIQRCHASVAEVLLGEEQQLAVRRHQLMRRHRLPVCQRADLRVRGADLLHSRNQLAVEFLARGAQAVRLGNRDLQHRVKGTVNAHAVCVRRLAEVLHGMHIVIGKDEHILQPVGFGGNQRHTAEGQQLRLRFPRDPILHFG